MRTAVDLERKDTGEQMAVGVDPSRDSLQLAILAPRNTLAKRVPLIPASLRSIDALLKDHQDVKIGVEGASSCGISVLLHWLRQGYDVREVNPQVSKRMRECLTEAHTDTSDAQGLAWSVRFHPRLPKVRISSATATWKRLAQARARLVKAQTALYNQLHAYLGESYGAVYKGLFRSLTSKMALTFFDEFPSLNDAAADPERVVEQLGEKRTAKLLEAGIWEEGIYLDVLRTEISVTIRLLLTYREALRAIERKMKELRDADPQEERLRSMPGIGTALALTILGHSGSFSRFRSQDVYAAYCGLAPAVWQSGRSRVYTRRRKRYNRPLKQAFLQLALTQLRVNPESRVYYDRKREEGKPHWIALTALARQLSKVVYTMMIEQTFYTRTGPLT